MTKDDENADNNNNDSTLPTSGTGTTSTTSVNSVVSEEGGLTIAIGKQSKDEAHSSVLGSNTRQQQQQQQQEQQQEQQQRKHALSSPNEVMSNSNEAGVDYRSAAVATSKPRKDTTCDTAMMSIINPPTSPAAGGADTPHNDAITEKRNDMNEFWVPRKKPRLSSSSSNNDNIENDNYDDVNDDKDDISSSSPKFSSAGYASSSLPPSGGAAVFGNANNTGSLSSGESYGTKVKVSILGESDPTVLTAQVRKNDEDYREKKNRHDGGSSSSLQQQQQQQQQLLLLLQQTTCSFSSSFSCNQREPDRMKVSLPATMEKTQVSTPVETKKDCEEVMKQEEEVPKMMENEIQDEKVVNITDNKNKQREEGGGGEEEKQQQQHDNNVCPTSHLNDRKEEEEEEKEKMDKNQAQIVSSDGGMPDGGRWRAHQIAEDYVKLVGNMMYPGIHLGPYGYDYRRGQYPIERITTLGLLTSPLRRPTVIEKWSPYEIATFESALTLYGKHFHHVQKVVRTKTTKEIIEFYYIWKKTSHYKKWKEQYEPDLLGCDDDDDDDEMNGIGVMGIVQRRK